MSESKEQLNEILREDDLASEFVDKQEGGVYLSGPIRCVEDNGHGWRDEIIEDYPEIDFKSPLDIYDPNEQEILSDPIEYDGESEKEQILPSEYVFEDKLQINQSEVIFLGLPEVISRGSCMEVMYAYMRNIPFFVWCMDEQKESGWLFEHSEFIGSDRDAVIEEVKRWL